MATETPSAQRASPSGTLTAEIFQQFAALLRQSGAFEEATIRQLIELAFADKQPTAAQIAKLLRGGDVPA